MYSWSLVVHNSHDDRTTPRILLLLIIQTQEGLCGGGKLVAPFLVPNLNKIWLSVYDMTR